MASLALPKPALIDVAMPANEAIGTEPVGVLDTERALTVQEALELLASGRGVFVDLREMAEIARDGTIPGSLHAPFPCFEAMLEDPGSALRQTLAGDAPVILFCAHGERSALALGIIAEHSLPLMRHLGEGFGRWRSQGGPVADLPLLYRETVAS